MLYTNANRKNIKVYFRLSETWQEELPSLSLFSSSYQYWLSHGFSLCVKKRKKRPLIPLWFCDGSLYEPRIWKRRVIAECTIHSRRSTDDNTLKKAIKQVERISIIPLSMAQIVDIRTPVRLASQSLTEMKYMATLKLSNSKFVNKF